DDLPVHGAVISPASCPRNSCGPWRDSLYGGSGAWRFGSGCGAVRAIRRGGCRDEDSAETASVFTIQAVDPRRACSVVGHTAVGTGDLRAVVRGASSGRRVSFAEDTSKSMRINVSFT